jgi:hypothetical protein
MVMGINVSIAECREALQIPQVTGKQMNNNRLIYCLIAMLVWFIINLQSVVSQSLYNEDYTEEAMNNCENITLFTDRNIYVVNEPVYFRSFYRKIGESMKEIWSKVLYVELVTPTGMAITNGKFYHDENGSSGYLTIPSDALTGNYYLRCYTMWMRNFGSQCFCYVPIKIINPFKPDVLSESDETFSVPASSFRMKDQVVKCHTDKISYSPGEEVQLNLNRSSYDSSFPDEYCLTVIPAGLADTMYAHINTKSLGTNEDFRFDYLPDIRGISISGTVINVVDQSPIPSARLHFSLLGENPGYFAIFTDDLGRFTVNLPDRTGIQELFVACEPSDDIKAEIKIEQDFTADPVPFATKPFVLSSQEKEIATQVFINMQLKKAYKVGKAEPNNPDNTYFTDPFHGIPKTIINTEDYVQLPTMAEIFKNLVPNVMILYQRREPYLKIESLNSNISLFPPLILIDQIPVFDLKAVLSANPSNIERLEVISDVYLTGNVMIGGIIILTSKKGNVAAIDLPQGSYFFDYQTFNPGNLRNWYDFYSNCKVVYHESQNTLINDDIINNRIPDSRNTLLWVDNIRIRSDERKILKFQASSRIGKYHILIRGVSNQGEVVCGIGTFKVEK